MISTRKVSFVFTAMLSMHLHAQEVQLDYIEEVLDLQLAATLKSHPEENDSVAIGFSALGRQFDLMLESNARVNALVNASAPGTGGHAYRGTLLDNPYSWARIVVSTTGPTGIIWDGTTLFGLESSVNANTGETATMIFRADDVYVPPNTLSCGMSDSPLSAAAMFATIAEEVATPAALVATLNLNIGLVADFEFTQIHGNPEAAMLERMNNIDGIFSEQVGVQITPQQVDVFDDADMDPFTDTTVAGDLLNELAVYRGANSAQDAMGLTHLFTGRELDGATVGIAYLNALCQQVNPRDSQMRSFGAGLTEARGAFGPTTALIESLVAAHELGHNFGAPHDGQSGGACAATPETFLMSASFSNSDQFSQCSLDQMAIEIESASCLTPAAFTDVALTGQATISETFTESQFDYTFTLTNQGTADAADTTLSIDFGSDFDVVRIQPQVGSCSAPSSTVSCALGVLAGSTTRTITATLRASRPGTQAIMASAAAPADAFLSNNALSDSVTVIAAVDLSVTGNPSTLSEDQLTTVTARLDNLSGMPAEGVTLTGNATGSVSIESVQIASQVCALSDGGFDCSLGTLPALSNATVQLSVRGGSAGSSVIAISASAQQADPNNSNNSTQLNLEVLPQPEPQNDGGGGGGALGSGGLLLLANLLWWRKRRLPVGSMNFS